MLSTRSIIFLKEVGRHLNDENYRNNTIAREDPEDLKFNQCGEELFTEGPGEAPCYMQKTREKRRNE